MKRISAITYVSLGLVALTLGLLSAAYYLKLVPDTFQFEARERARICETLALNFAAAVQAGDIRATTAATRSLVDREPELLSVGLRNAAGTLVFETANHTQRWQDPRNDREGLTHASVPIMREAGQWGTVECRFAPTVANTRLWFLYAPLIQLSAFVMCGGFIAYRLYLRRVLTYLDPRRVIPERVRAAFDTLAEGLLVLDDKGRIVLANDVFCRSIARTEEELQGHDASDLPWLSVDNAEPLSELPWTRASLDLEPQKGIRIRFQAEDEILSFMVNASPIQAEKGKVRGVLATFDNVTGLENKNAELAQMVEQLQVSREQIRKQNDDLMLLATRDPLTGCLNRRAFLEVLEKESSRCDRNDSQLGCVMADIDHFKSINDQHGHRVGDQVLQKCAAALKQNMRVSDYVCRYGGEEFCILLPESTMEQAAVVAEKLRAQVAEIMVGGKSVTASFGVSVTENGKRMEELVEEADQALYHAKRSGRDRVIRFDEIPEDALAVDLDPNEPVQPEQPRPDIPLVALDALLAALAYRDSTTAAHSRRVAGLCVALASDMMSAGDCFILEIAALLHDVGKIGVPDSILLKPGPLTDEEWKVMGDHERIGIEIINSAFRSKELTTIVQYHHAYYGEDSRHPGMPKGVDIPVRSRILAIADSYDAMISDRPYRLGLTEEAAINELKRCAGTQFDPWLVDKFIDMLEARGGNRGVNALPQSVEVAAEIGIQAERLLAAIDGNDFALLGALSDRLSAVATRNGFSKVAEMAKELSQTVEEEHDLENALRSTRELLDLCRSVQKDLLEAGEQHQGPTKMNETCEPEEA